MVVGQAHRPQRAPFPAARGGEHLRAEVPGQLHRREPDAASGGVHEDGLSRPHAGDLRQALVGGAERHRHRGGLGERPPVRNAGECLTAGDRERAERPVEQAHHPVAGGQAAGLRADLGHDPRPLDADRPLGWQQAQRHRHVPEVESRRAHRDADLVSHQRGHDLGAGHQGQSLDRAGARLVQPPRTGAGRRDEVAGG